MDYNTFLAFLQPLYIFPDSFIWALIYFRDEYKMDVSMGSKARGLRPF